MSTRSRIVLGSYATLTLLAAVAALNPTMRGEATIWLAATGLPWNLFAALAVERVDSSLFESVWPWIAIAATLLNGVLLAWYLKGQRSRARSIAPAD